MDSTDDSMLIEGPNWRWRNSFRKPTRNPSVPGEQSFNSQNTLTHTHKNLHLLVEGMFKQFAHNFQPRIKHVSPQPNQSVEHKPRIRLRPSTAVKRPPRARVPIIMQVPTKPEESVVNPTTPQNREKMFQALLHKLGATEKSIAIRPKSSSHIAKRGPYKLDRTQSQSTDTASNRYEMLETIGSGAYAVVRKARDTMTNKIVAIKSYEKSKMLNLERKKASLHEIKMLQQLEHRCIVKLLNVIQTKNTVSLVLEYPGNQTLYHVLKEKNDHRFQESEFKHIFAQIVSAVEYCHSKDVAHRDIKVENILLNGLHVKLIDFGLADEATKYLTTHCGTPSYMPPEVCQRRTYKGQSADIWALGIVLYVSLIGKFPFEGKSDETLFSSIINNKLKMPTSLSNDAQHLLKLILQKDSQRRPTATQILSQAWLTK